MRQTRRHILAAAAALVGAPASAQVGIFALDAGIAPHRPAASSEPEPTDPVRIEDLAILDRNAGKTQAGLPDTRGLWVIHPELAEQVMTVFFAKGQSVDHGYTLLCRILRDPVAGRVAPVDPVLLHMLWHIQRQTGFTKPVQIRAGYQTEKTARRLNAETKEVAAYHLASQACDFTIDGVTHRQIVAAAQVFGRGGVGIYRDYIHIDTGPIRRW